VTAASEKDAGVVPPPLSGAEQSLDLGLCIVGSSQPKPGTGGSAGSRPLTGADDKPPQVLSF